MALDLVIIEPDTSFRRGLVLRAQLAQINVESFVFSHDFERYNVGEGQRAAHYLVSFQDPGFSAGRGVVPLAQRVYHFLQTSHIPFRSYSIMSVWPTLADAPVGVDLSDISHLVWLDKSRTDWDTYFQKLKQV